MNNSVSYQFETRLIDSLKPHPLNGEAFDVVEDDDFKLLMKDINDRGLQIEPDVLPDGDLIITGHRRIEACRRLGHTEIRCRVRYDLADATPAEIAIALINDNLHRRQLSNLGIARALWVRMEAVAGDKGCYSKLNNLIGPLASALRTSERNARRYLRVLKTPLEVQHAMDNGALSLVLADKVAGLSAKVQKEIGTRIASGESAKAVVSAFINKSKGKSAADKDQTVPVGQLIEGADAWTKAIATGKWIPPKQRQALARSTKALIGALNAKQSA